MEAKITSYRTLQISPSEYNKDERVAETIFIEDILKLKNEGDSILLTRRNASGLSCLAYLESRPVENLATKVGVNEVKNFLKNVTRTDFKKVVDNQSIQKQVMMMQVLHGNLYRKILNEG